MGGILIVNNKTYDKKIILLLDFKSENDQHRPIYKI